MKRCEMEMRLLSLPPSLNSPMPVFYAWSRDGGQESHLFHGERPGVDSRMTQKSGTSVTSWEKRRRKDKHAAQVCCTTRGGCYLCATLPPQTPWVTLWVTAALPSSLTFTMRSSVANVSRPSLRKRLWPFIAFCRENKQMKEEIKKRDVKENGYIQQMTTIKKSADFFFFFCLPASLNQLKKKWYWCVQQHIIILSFQFISIL